jgi:hypothetical protein
VLTGSGRQAATCAAAAAPPATAPAAIAAFRIAANGILHLHRSKHMTIAPRAQLQAGRRCLACAGFAGCQGAARRAELRETVTDA